MTVKWQSWGGGEQSAKSVLLTSLLLCEADFLPCNMGTSMVMAMRAVYELIDSVGHTVSTRHALGLETEERWESWQK